MKLTEYALMTLTHRAVLALVLLAFLLPGPARLPADDLRAAYVAAGLICDPGEAQHAPDDAHCVLCLLPATGAAPEGVGCAMPMLSARIDLAARVSEPSPTRRGAAHHARAPPSSLV